MKCTFLAHLYLLVVHLVNRLKDPLGGHVISGITQTQTRGSQVYLLTVFIIQQLQFSRACTCVGALSALYIYIYLLSVHIHVQVHYLLSVRIHVLLPCKSPSLAYRCVGALPISFLLLSFIIRVLLISDSQLLYNKSIIM